MRLGDREFSHDLESLESGAVLWSDASDAAAICCPTTAAVRVEELEAAAALQNELACASDSGSAWCAARAETVERDGREFLAVVSCPPEGALNAQRLIDEERSNENDGELARLVWSLAVGILRALIPIHERGMHHGELSPETAMRDRIVARRRVGTDASPAGFEVWLQLPSPKLARRLRRGLQVEVASPEQADVARLAHLLAAIIHRRDPLDPDTSIASARLEDLFGDAATAWRRFFDEASSGPLHSDAAFIRSRLSLLEPATPREVGVTSDLKITIGRALSRRTAIWGGAAAAMVVVGGVLVAFFWGTLFPKTTWKVVIKSNEPEERGQLTVQIDSPGGAPPKDLYATWTRGNDHPRIDFKPDGDGFVAQLPESDGPYELTFDDRDGTKVTVNAKDDPTVRTLEQKYDDALGTLTVTLTERDIDSTPDDQPTIELFDGEKALSIQSNHARGNWRSDDKGNARTSTATFDVSALLGDVDRQVRVRVKATDADERVKLPALPFAIKWTPQSPKAGDELRLLLEPSLLKPSSQTARFSPRIALLDAKNQPIAARLEQPGVFVLPWDKSSYTVTIQVAAVSKSLRVEGFDRPATYSNLKVEPNGDENDPKARLRISVDSSDPDTAPRERVVEASWRWNGETGTVKLVPAPSADPSAASGSTVTFTGPLELNRSNMGLSCEVAVGGETATTTIAAAKKAEPIKRPAKRPKPQATRSERKVNLSVEDLSGESGKLEWRVISEGSPAEQPPAWLLGAVESQLSEVNRDADLYGSVTAPDFSKTYQLRFQLFEKDGNQSTALGPPESFTFEDTDDPTTYPTVVARTAEGQPLAYAGGPVNTTRITLEVVAADRDSSSTVEGFTEPVLSIDGNTKGWDDSNSSANPGRPEGKQEWTKNYTKVINVVSSKDQRIEVKAGSSTLWAGTVYFDPADPTTAKVFLAKAFQQVGDDWLSSPLAVDAKGEFDTASAVGTSRSPGLTKELVDKLLERYKDCGFDARIVTPKELLEELERVKQKSNPPQKGDVAQAVLGPAIENWKRNPKNSTFQDHRREFGNPEDLKSSVEPPGIEYFATFVRPTDDNPIGVGVIGLPLAALVNWKGVKQALWSGDAWRPAPWPKEAVTPKTQAYVRLVLTKKPREREK